MSKVRVAIFNEDYGLHSGGSEVTAVAAQALAERGFLVTMYALGSFRNYVVEVDGSSSGIPVKGLPDLYLKKKLLGSYTKLLSRTMAGLLVRGELLLDFGCSFIQPIRVPDLTYCNYPWALPTREGKSKLAYWVYDTIAQDFLGALAEKRVIANSAYVRRAIQELWGLDPLILYPPVKTHEFSPHSECRKGVVSLARFRPAKNHEWQLQVAREFPEVDFTLMGGIQTVEESNHFARLLALRPDNVIFRTNLDRNEVRRHLEQAKVFLHTMVCEQFGIAIVEAIAAGCIPVVHDSGGAPEVVPFKELRYSTLEECREIIRKALVGRYDSLRKPLLENIARFDEKNFKERIVEIVGSLHKP